MQNELDISKKLEIIEAVLYAAGHPVTYDKLADILEVTPSVAKELVCMYEEKYNNTDLPRGIQLIRFDKACQLCTKSEYESQVKLALGVKQGRGNLSNSSLEVLAIIAYHQPVTRAYIDQVRGLDSSYSVALLMEKNLIEKKGRLDVPGRPSLYGTTLDFLRCFGLSSLEQLPSVEMLSFDTEEDNPPSENSDTEQTNEQ
ncbi:MAG: SMC-Scp complex subunit ScpB [Ruminococcaceae bacterium]|nr:SMC-Scp complex subunit ScpB [Oscillospiraceae bacterium]